MTLDTWESLDRLARFSTVEQVAEDAGQTVEETQADLDVLVQAQRVRRKGRRVPLYRALRVDKSVPIGGGWSRLLTEWP